MLDYNHTGGGIFNVFVTKSWYNQMKSQSTSLKQSCEDKQGSHKIFILKFHDFSRFFPGFTYIYVCIYCQFRIILLTECYIYWTLYWCIVYYIYWALY